MSKSGGGGGRAPATRTNPHEKTLGNAKVAKAKRMKKDAGPIAVNAEAAAANSAKA
jgi:hypothetical protein